MKLLQKSNGHRGTETQRDKGRVSLPVFISLCLVVCLPLCFCASVAISQEQSPGVYFLKPAWIFDGVSVKLIEGMVVLVRGDKIEAVGPASEVKAPADARVIDLPNMTLLPGLIEAHSHVLLHPYNE